MSDNQAFRRDTFQLPLERYIQLLEEARRELAVKRCLNEKLKCPAAQRLDGIEVSSSVVWATG
jgi:hypothetical protein